MGKWEITPLSETLLLEKSKIRRMANHSDEWTKIYSKMSKLEKKGKHFNEGMKDEKIKNHHEQRTSSKNLELLLKTIFIRGSMILYRNEQGWTLELSSDYEVYFSDYQKRDLQSENHTTSQSHNMHQKQ